MQLKTPYKDGTMHVMLLWAFCPSPCSTGPAMTITYPADPQMPPPMVSIRSDLAHMGQLSITVDLLRLDKNNVARPLRRFADAYNDSCDATAGERRRSAKTITTTSTIDGKPRFSISDYQLPCAGEQ